MFFFHRTPTAAIPAPRRAKLALRVQMLVTLMPAALINYLPSDRSHLTTFRL